MIDVPINLWRVGNIVSRDGTDEHVIVGIYGTEEPETIRVRCIKEPSTRWIKVGEIEDNLISRYKWLRSEQ